jgi:hypothetical protein
MDFEYALEVDHIETDLSKADINPYYTEDFTINLNKKSIIKMILNEEFKSNIVTILLNNIVKDLIYIVLIYLEETIIFNYNFKYFNFYGKYGRIYYEYDTQIFKGVINFSYSKQENKIKFCNSEIIIPKNFIIKYYKVLNGIIFNNDRIKFTNIANLSYLIDTEKKIENEKINIIFLEDYISKITEQVNNNMTLFDEFYTYFNSKLSAEFITDDFESRSILVSISNENFVPLSAYKMGKSNVLTFANAIWFLYYLIPLLQTSLNKSLIT